MLSEDNLEEVLRALGLSHVDVEMVQSKEEEYTARVSVGFISLVSALHAHPVVYNQSTYSLSEVSIVYLQRIDDFWVRVRYVFTPVEEDEDKVLLRSNIQSVVFFPEDAAVSLEVPSLSLARTLRSNEVESKALAAAAVL